MKRLLSYFSRLEITLWCSSIALILVSFLAFDRTNYLTLIASLIGVTSLIFNAKGNPFGQVLMVIFSLLYGIISYTFAYYGEMITYLGMPMPMAVFALISWLRNPYSETEVKVAKMTTRKWIYLSIGTVFVTVVMGAILAVFNTPNLIVSIISVATSFAASMLTILRSPYYALFYAANDIVLIVLWI